MGVPRFHDAVSLRHFAVVDRLDICESEHGHLPPPRWCAEVETEIRGAVRHEPSCNRVLAATWLGAPVEPAPNELVDVYEIQVGLNDGRRPPGDDAGEAESIFFAEKLGGTFLTDDNAAFDFAQRRLGAGRVVDSVYVLQTATANGTLTSREAADLRTLSSPRIAISGDVTSRRSRPATSDLRLAGRYQRTWHHGDVIR